MKWVIVFIVWFAVTGVLVTPPAPVPDGAGLKAIWDSSAERTLTERDTIGVVVGLACALGVGWLMAQRDRDWGIKFEVIVMLVVVGFLLYGLATVVIPVSLHMGQYSSLRGG